jgi:hypothetical protein
MGCSAAFAAPRLSGTPHGLRRGESQPRRRRTKLVPVVLSSYRDTRTPATVRQRLRAGGMLV